MAFERQENLFPNQLTTQTQQRFTELEMAKALHILKVFHESPSLALTNLIAPFNPEPQRRALIMAFESYNFKNPTTREHVHYFRYRNLSIHKIRKYTRASLNSLIKGGKYDEVPDLYPIFPYWDDMQSALITWELQKHRLNLFNEDLVHTQKPKEYALSNPENPTEKPQKKLTDFEKAIKAMNEAADKHQQELLKPWHERQEHKTIGKTMNEELLEAEGYEDPMLAFEEE